MIAVMSFIPIKVLQACDCCVAESTSCASDEVLSAISSLTTLRAVESRIYAPIGGVGQPATSHRGARRDWRLSSERQFQPNAAVLILRLIVGHQKHTFWRDLRAAQQGLLHV